MTGSGDPWSARVSADSPVDLIGPSQNVSIKAGDPGYRAANALNCRQSPAKTTWLRTCDEAPIRNATWILSRRRGLARSVSSGRLDAVLKSMSGRRGLRAQVVGVLSISTLSVPSRLEGASRTGWDGPPDGWRRSSAVSGARACRRDRLRLDAVRIPSRQFADAHGRGGIRTHAGRCPHDFQSCALSHSATRP